MKKLNKFLENYKQASKSLYKAGEQVTLYKTKYTVLSSTPKFTLLRDEKGYPTAYPTDKLSQLLKSSEAPIKKAVDERMKAGMIRVDKVDSKGRKYHYWIHATKGTAHQEASESSKGHEVELDQESKQLKGRMEDIISKHSHPSDKKQLTEKLNSFLKAKLEHNNIIEANNQLDRKGGGFNSNTFKLIEGKERAYKQKFQDLVDSLKASKAKPRNVTIKE